MRDQERLRKHPSSTPSAKAHHRKPALSTPPQGVSPSSNAYPTMQGYEVLRGEGMIVMQYHCRFEGCGCHHYNRSKQRKGRSYLRTPASSFKMSSIWTDYPSFSKQSTTKHVMSPCHLVRETPPSSAQFNTNLKHAGLNLNSHKTKDYRTITWLQKQTKIMTIQLRVFQVSFMTLLIRLGVSKHVM